MKYKTFFITLSFLLLISPNCNEKPKTEQTIESNTKQKAQITGKWVSKNVNNKMTYEFFSDNTWRSVYEGTITKGKYVIGEDDDVFLRCFGSQHWHNNGDTTIDDKTSIGARVMFLYDSILVNNQEDYSERFYLLKDK